MATQPPDHDVVIAVVNSSEDTLAVLREVLRQHGFPRVVTARAHDILHAGTNDFLALVGHHQPAALIYDIAIPYDRNWRILQVLLTSEVMQGRPVVVTTTNKRALEEIVGPTSAFEIIGKPYDLEQIVAAVGRALSGRP